ncbi:unnamed protein product [Symbiodinium sp. CCMP2592]|nr:unnamed protein product [Symbiodinium sp. CCMP2592]
MELASQLHAIMNHVKQPFALVTNFRNEAMPSLHKVQGIGNTQWGQADVLNALQDLTGSMDEKLKLTPPMPTKAPPPSPPASSAPTTAPPTSTTGTSPTPAAPTPASSSATPTVPCGQPQSFGPASNSSFLGI